MKAIISDIHGNLEALQAVLDTIDQLGVREVICLGDVVGYGPQPRECLDIVKNVAKFTILGNHEEAVLDGTPASFTERARKAIAWTRKTLFDDESEPQKVRDDRRAAMREFKIQMRQDGVQFVHGSPRDPTREYVMPRDTISDKKKMNEIFACLEDYCFCGHTHTPGVFTTSGFSHPSDMFDLYILGSHEKVLLNVGSVGQPRDGDPRACFVTFDGDTIVWRRVEYDVEAVCGKIYANPDLDDFLADRLRDGK